MKGHRSGQRAQHRAQTQSIFLAAMLEIENIYESYKCLHKLRRINRNSERRKYPPHVRSHTKARVKNILLNADETEQALGAAAGRGWLA